MNKNNLVKIIVRELAILTDVVNGFSDTENIHPMEVDLALSKAKDIYNELMLLKGVEQVSDSVSPKIEETPKTMLEAQSAKTQRVIEPIDIVNEESIVDPQIQTELLDIKEIVLDIVSEKPLNTEVVEEVIPEEPIELIENEIRQVEPEQIEQIKPIISIIEDKKAHEVMVDPAPEPKLPEGIVEIKPKKVVQKLVDKEDKAKSERISDKFQKESFSINDRLASVKSKNDLISVLKGTPISDLKKAIKLNDRVWFTNELFNKNGATFENAVDKVNNSADLDTALNYLLENFNWNQESQSTISFLELVFRRFPSK